MEAVVEPVVVSEEPVAAPEQEVPVVDEAQPASNPTEPDAPRKMDELTLAERKKLRMARFKQGSMTTSEEALQ